MMGSRQLFCLRWSNHQTNMLSVFDELLQNEALVDVTIACEGLSIKAHKVVLSACSPYFQNLFVQNPCKHPIVILKDIKYSELKALVDFMYKGEVNVTQEQLNALLKTAESLKIKGLAEVTGGLNGQNERSDAGSPPPPPPPPPLTLHQQQQQQQHHQRGHLRRNLPPVSSSSSSSADVALAPVAPATCPVAESYPLPVAASVAITPCSGAAVAPTVSCLKLEHSPPPPLKRRKVRHRRKSAEKGGAGDSDGEGGDGTVRGSPEVIEAKVEMAEEGFDSGPGRPPDGDPDQDAEAGGRLDRPSDAASESVHDTSSQCSFRSQELGPLSVRSDDMVVAPLSARLKPTFTFEPPIGVAVGGASTSGEGSSQGDVMPSAALRLDYGPGYIPKRGQPRIMNVDEEQMIVKFILEMAAKGRPVTRRCVLEFGNTLLRRHDRVPTGSIHCNPEKGLSNDWWKEFKKRHPGLPLRSSSSSSSSSSTSSQHQQLPSSV